MSIKASKIKENRVCVLLINFFSADKTIQCINSILSEQLRTIYILDNSADVIQKKLLKEYIEKSESSKSALSMKYLSYNENLGFSKGINKILQYDYLTKNNHTHYCLLNNDTIAEKGFINPLINALVHGGYTLVSPKINGSDQLVRYNYYGWFSGMISLKNFPFSFPYISGCCLMFRSDWLQKKNLFDEDFFMYGEDVELCWRLANEKKRIQVIDDSTIYHEGSVSSNKGSLFYEYYVARSHILLINKIQKSSYKRIFSYLGKSVFLMIRAFVRVYSHRNLIPLKAYLMCWFDYKIRPESGRYKLK